ncbi:hypothetical protein P280DRAFT_483840 [Massarina eburnea CBS 473.64]|uniref:Uncharacterized protein n=1 Tax=Massarina eburnea CBS 473.64 TaxID=1395130 RepID=A0A6A6RL07_9PLEO|nr:hypothetical protein P280DRAFT_483840 [Massarina eburnea CBS 473.64]
MRLHIVAALALSSPAFTSAIKFADLLRFTESSSLSPAATPGSIPWSHAPKPTYARDLTAFDKLEMRQAPAAAPVAPVPVPPAANPAVPKVDPAAVAVAPIAPVANPNPAPVVPPAVAPIAPIANPIPPVAPAAPTTTVPAAAVPGANPSQSVSVTVQWLPTMIKGSTTWAPRTITLTFKLKGDSALPAPGSGAIGMGTITGQVGVTKTIVKGAAETRGPGVLGLGVGVLAGFVGARMV